MYRTSCKRRRAESKGWKKDALLLYVPLSNALNLLAGETVSIFIAKEKPKIIAMILALLSILVVLFF